MHCYSVSDVNRFLKQIVAAEDLLYSIHIEGEISNFVYHRSGHMYFTLKDEASSIKCVFFRTFASELLFVPENGMKVVVQGDIQVYERDGIYQLYGRKMRQQGKGNGAEALLALAKRLESEGLFSPQRKREIPTFPKTIGVVTAEKAAALQDIIKIVSRRYPVVELRIYPAVVQGKKAAESLCKALQTASKNPPDVLIIGRGGGSKEDLAAFQEESVVRAIADFPVPVIAAIGHETDTTLSDLAADLRAPTPSAAAELATPDKHRIKENTDNLRRALYVNLKELINENKAKCEFLKQRCCRAVPEEKLVASFEHLCFLDFRLSQQIKNKLSGAFAELSHKAELLASASPLKTLERGYAIAYGENNTPVFSVKQLQVGESFSLRFKDGEISATVIKNNDKSEK